MAALDLSPEEITSICSAAQVAWDKLRPNQRTAKFVWRGRSFVATHSGFRLCVDTPDGRPVACRYD
jgi:hypothetical protein